MSDFDPTLALIAASDGDQSAWDAIVTNFGGLVWSVIRGFRLSEADTADVFQATWFRLVERLGSIRDGDGLGGWLATTARRESINVLRRFGRETPTGDFELGEAEPRSESPEDAVVRSERDRLLWAAFARLPQRCQELLRLVLADPPLSYEQVSELLSMPIGSIGPTRGRCLKTLGATLGFTRAARTVETG